MICYTYEFPKGRANMLVYYVKNTTGNPQRNFIVPIIGASKSVKCEEIVFVFL